MRTSPWNRPGLSWTAFAVPAALVATLTAAGCNLAGGSDAAAGGPDSAAGGGEGGGESAAGRLVIVGGALAADNADVYRAILEARQGEGPLCVLPTASGVPAESMTSAVERMDRWGGPGTAEGILLTVDAPERADDPELAARLRACSGFFFTGGVQSRVVETLRPEGRSTVAREALMERWRAGAVVAGTSAGAAMMGGEMIAGGSSAGAVAHGVAPSADGDGDGVVIEPGMGFFEFGWLDQHFLARGRWGRLLVAALRVEPYATGLGIDENTALVVDGATGRVVGASGVVVIDARGAVSTSDGVDGIRVELAGDGDVIDLRTLAVTPAAAKAAWPGPEGVTPSEGASSPQDAPSSGSASPAGESDGDPFPRWGLLRDLARMAGTGEATVYRVGAGATITLTPSPAFRARAWAAGNGEEGATGPEGAPHGLQVGPIEVSITGSLAPGGA